MRSVTSAIKGAAPKKPAKAFRSERVPNATKAETAIPPPINRKKYSKKGVASQMMSGGRFYSGRLFAETLSWHNRLSVFCTAR
jgi:hypothetical protein